METNRKSSLLPHSCTQAERSNYLATLMTYCNFLSVEVIEWTAGWREARNQWPRLSHITEKGRMMGRMRLIDRPSYCQLKEAILSSSLLPIACEALRYMCVYLSFVYFPLERKPLAHPFIFKDIFMINNITMKSFCDKLGIKYW